MSRLGQTHPQIDAWLAALPRAEQLRAAAQVARLAAHRAGLPAPPPDVDLATWADEVDARGWERDAAGEWQQDEDDFARARAAAARRDAATDRPDAAADAVYEAVAALGADAVRRELGIVGG